MDTRHCKEKRGMDFFLMPALVNFINVYMVLIWFSYPFGIRFYTELILPLLMYLIPNACLLNINDFPLLLGMIYQVTLIAFAEGWQQGIYCLQELDLYDVLK